MCVCADVVDMYESACFEEGVVLFSCLVETKGIYVFKFVPATVCKECLIMLVCKCKFRPTQRERYFRLNFAAGGLLCSFVLTNTKKCQ